MKFGPVALDEAQGALLAHRLRLEGGALKKGRVLTAADLAALRDAGYQTVTVARLDSDDLGEDAAAEAVARAAGGAGLSLGTAATGRCNIYAARRGIAVIERDRIDACNRIDEAITIATVAPFTPVEAGDLVATVKIIPLAAPRATVGACVAVASAPEPLVRVAETTRRTVGLIQTRLAGTKSSVLDKTVATMGARLGALGATLARERRCDHDEVALAKAIGALADVELLLILGASAIVDRRDVVPAAIEAAGGTVEHFGMPVDPGNLTLLAWLGETPVIGLPGSARSPRIHGVDWLLRRLLVGATVTGRDIMAMGAGGLLKEIAQRPLPRAKASPPPSAAPDAPPRIAALVLAAGRSRRFGAVNKLLAEVDGTPMVARVVAAATASKAATVVVVTGHQAAKVRAALAGAEFVDSPDYAAGLSASLRAGLAALPDDIDGAVVCLGDMPRVTAGLIDALIDAFEPAQGAAICLPTHRGKRGNPVLWARRFFAEMAAVTGDTGARHLIGEHADVVCEVPCDDDAVLVDVDTPEALDAIS